MLPGNTTIAANDQANFGLQELRSSLVTPCQKNLLATLFLVMNRSAKVVTNPTGLLQDWEVWASRQQAKLY
jgi:hypothetical protein